MTKRSGERGSACLTPLLQWNSFPKTSLRRIEDVPESRILLTQSHHMSLKTRHCIILRLVLCSIVSNAFPKSNFKMIISLFDYWHWWIYSKAHTRQSWIVLFFIKPYWLWWTIGMMLLCNLFAMILVRSFKTKFIRLIGLKSLMVVGLLHLGIRVTKELLIAFKTSCPTKNSSQRVKDYKCLDYVPTPLESRPS